MMKDIPEIQPPDWIISDTHFGHLNIMEYCPWRKNWANNIHDHDKAIISAWNSTVRPTDTVLHLGDFCLGPRDFIFDYRKALLGKIILVRGNHDRSRLAMLEAGIDRVETSLRIRMEDIAIFCKHDPGSFSRMEAESSNYLIHGHCHGNPMDTNIHKSIRLIATDCSMDALKSVTPISWNCLCENLREKERKNLSICNFIR